MKMEEVKKAQENTGHTFYPMKDEITSLDSLRKCVIENFPDIWDEVKACLSTVCSLSLKHLNGCPSLNLIGNPSGEKTTVLSLFYGHDLTYLSDDFTPKAFVSHSANVKKEDLGEIDLLPKIRNKVLISPELAPLFEGSKEKLIDNFAILTRVLDGEGLKRDSGVHGGRGYEGDYKFAWLGASTPLRSHVWNVMGKLGNRLFFYNMRDKNRTNDDYLKMFSGTEYEEKVNESRSAVRSFLNHFFKNFEPRSVKWVGKDENILKKIIIYAKLLSKLRGSLVTWKSTDKDQDTIEYTFPIVEEPPRAINALRNFARGHAMVNGRSYLTEEDLGIVKQVCLSSMPHDRREFLKLLQKHNGRLSTETISQELKCSQDTALRTMKTFEVLDVVKLKDVSLGVGHPIRYIELNEEFKELLNSTQG